ncbi:MAG: porin family protein [Megasphaera sp.]|jgi:OOP family OmpA-OmpF porin|uniref:outer membrane beta-barrel protein n=1 Tax=Megasphaera sueciensis TaxID=349094 RepID=UPI002ACB150A|nr:porin family protein [Megasphaera sp.]MCI1823740.1 porin family protein [Megasphaera sp.]
MKKIPLAWAMVLTVCMTSFVFATPQTQWNQGEAQIDLGTWNVKAKSGGESSSSKWNVNGGVMYGLNNQWAVQYEYWGLKTKNDWTTGNSQEINAVYSLNKNFAFYGGWNRIKNSTNVTSEYNVTNNVLQVGVVAKAPIGNNFDMYAKGELGTKKTSLWETGVGYAVSKDLDVNVGYRHLNTEVNSDNNITYKGFIANVSYRFGGGSTAKK